jgi:hypothetical protein
LAINTVAKKPLASRIGAFYDSDSMRHNLVRFVTNQIDAGSGRRRGVFQAVADLVQSNTMSGDDLQQLLALRQWFNDHLEKPSRFA